jgi:ABC-2 type transport system ATP-binding protein
VRALDAENLKLEHLELHQPSLDDVFLAKTGRSLEGAGDEEEEEAASDGPVAVETT